MAQPRRPLPSGHLHMPLAPLPCLLWLQAFVLYEESIPDSRQEIRALQSIMGTLHRCRGVAAEPGRAAGWGGPA